MTSEKTHKETTYQRNNSHSSRSPLNLMAYGKLATAGPDHLQNNGYGNAVMQSMSYPHGNIQLKKEGEENIQLKQEGSSSKENNTGMPDDLKSGIENLSGLSMDDVKVHYNSDKPAQMKAHAYAQGTDIHVASGQEKHLPHEAWHVVQQKQGRVKPTVQMKGDVNVNDDPGLEKEADVMGAKALQMKAIGGEEKGIKANEQDLNPLSPLQSATEGAIQRKGLANQNFTGRVMQLIGERRIKTLLGLYKNSNSKFIPYLDNLDFSELLDLLRENDKNSELVEIVRKDEVTNAIKAVLAVRLKNRHGVTDKSIKDYLEIQHQFKLPDLPEEFAPKERMPSVQMGEDGLVGEHSIPRDISILHSQEREIQEACGILVSGSKQFEIALTNSAGTKLNHILPANRIIKHLVNSWNMAYSSESRVMMFNGITRRLGINIPTPSKGDSGYDPKELKRYMITVVQNVTENGYNVFCYPYTLGDNGGSDIDGITDVEKVQQSNKGALVEVENGWKFNSGKLSELSEKEKLEHYLSAKQKIKERYQIFVNIVFE